MLVRFRKALDIQGFHFQKGWWGEFSTDKKLVAVYAYPWAEYDYYTDEGYWRNCRVFHPTENGFEGGWANQAPKEIEDYFNKVADNLYLSKWEWYDWYYDED